MADERARRFDAFPTVADLGAGIGLDTLALARAGRRVVAVERDPARVALLRHNVVAAGVADRVTVVEGDLRTATAPADAAFLDPDRRSEGHRTRDPERFEPPASSFGAIAARYGALLAKLPPATLPASHPGQGVEWVSLDGEVKEARVGYGALALPTARRALLLPTGIAFAGAGRAWPPPRAPVVGDVLLLPDPAIVVAGLVGDAAASVDARPVHPRIAALVATTAVAWARCVGVDAVLSADPRAIRAALDARGCGDVEVRTRGVEDPADAWRRRIGVRPGPRAIVVVTRGPDDRYLSLVSFDSGPGATAPRPAGMP